MGFPIPVSLLSFWVDRKRKHPPYATYTIIAICVLVYAFFWIQSIATALGGGDWQFFQQTYLTNNALVFSDPSILGFFMHAFTHISFYHLFFNMLELWLIGCILEDAIGTPLYVLFYFTSLIVAMLLTGLVMHLFVPDDLGVYNMGASGALSGVVGWAAFRHYRLRVLTLPAILIPLPFPPGMFILPVWKPFWMPFWISAGYFTVQEVWNGVAQIVSGASSGVAHWAHLGGLLMGVAAACLFKSTKDEQYDYAVEDANRVISGRASRATVQQNLERLNRERPDDPQALEALAKLHTAQGRVDDARQCYIGAINNYLRAHDNRAAADAYMQMVLALPPTALDPRLQIGVGNALEAIGRYRDALMAYEEVIENHPTSDEAQTALLRGAQLRLRHLNDPVQAEWMLRALIEDHPASPWVPVARQRLQEMGKMP